MDSHYSLVEASSLRSRTPDEENKESPIDDDTTILPQSKKDRLPWDDVEDVPPALTDLVRRQSKRDSAETSITNACRLDYLKLWWLEIVASFAILLGLIALSTLLGLYSGGPRSQWPYFLSVNAIVAALVTVLRLAILFIAVEG
ncbi:hypothetical protein MMC10_000925 [Thelotrema lepadinum]|nr:hypothetical protein [Thelotrema lepadinum]